MKRCNKLTALLMTAVLLCTLWAPAVTAEPVAAVTQNKQENVLEAPKELLAKLENGQKLCAAYDAILEAVDNGKDFVDLGNGYLLTDEEQEILRSVVDATFPESYGNHIGHSYCTVGEDYFYSWFYDWGMNDTHKEAVNQRVTALTADLKGKSDYEKSRILYERLVEENTYNFGVYHQTAYGALVEGMSVCAGYARSYQLLLQAVGIPCLYITGTADNGFGVGGHAWNLVKLDGEWYYSDATWDDFDDPNFPLTYTYFNITYDEISEDHFPDEAYLPWLPTEDATQDNYFYKEGAVCDDTITWQELAQLFKQQNPLMLHVRGDRDKVLSLFNNNTTAIAQAIGHNRWNSARTRQAGNHGLVLTLTLPHELDNTWWQDDTHHAHLCTVCQSRVDYGKHAYNDDVCTVCGYTKKPDVVAGDANGDGKVNNRDLGMLQRYLNGWNIEVDATAADLSGDGKVNNRDLGMLQKKLNQ